MADMSDAMIDACRGGMGDVRGVLGTVVTGVTGGVGCDIVHCPTSVEALASWAAIVTVSASYQRGGKNQ